MDVKVDFLGLGQRFTLQLYKVICLFHLLRHPAGSIYASQSSQSQSPEPMSFTNSPTAYLPLSSLSTSQSDLQSHISSAQFSKFKLTKLRAIKIPSSIIDRSAPRSATTLYSCLCSDDDTVLESYQSIDLHHNHRRLVFFSLRSNHAFNYFNSTQHYRSLSCHSTSFIDRSDAHHFKGRFTTRLRSCLSSKQPRFGDGKQRKCSINSLLHPIPPLSQLISGGANPPANENTLDDDWDSFTLSSSTESDPPSSCSLPLSLGGVVNPFTLRIYGSANVTVMDASCFSYGDDSGSSGSGSGSAGSGRDTGGGVMAIMGRVESRCDDGRLGLGFVLVNPYFSSDYGQFGDTIATCTDQRAR
ncbi:hypothetical protein K435DRAFT_855526 [Dendrothele bispora CBS 962.96]|uniref:Uncharacterized protein n=1 Tax=Dendrothele bispora (strain CBS 962.96) TaxID=1314807 RepID=A0A4S8MB69_DENBC|nr:hypothetical protein K435DRAFT_855526 [Dendrothele bispora CBS 962.96]